MDGRSLDLKFWNPLFQFDTSIYYQAKLNEPTKQLIYLKLNLPPRQIYWHEALVGSELLDLQGPHIVTLMFSYIVAYNLIFCQQRFYYQRVFFPLFLFLF